MRAITVALALLFILLEWITRLLSNLVHSLIALLGFSRFEAWMRALPLWCVVPITLFVAAGYVLLEIAQFALLARRLYLFAGLAHVLKWLSLPILSYIWRLYGERLLRYSWIRHIYNFYMFAHELVLGWVHRQEWYGKALEFKDRLAVATRKRLASARQTFQQWRAAGQHRHTVFEAARRLKAFRFRAK